MAIAWMYRDDYAAGGLRMLPGIDPKGVRTAATMVLTAAMLLPVGAAISLIVGGWVAAVGAAFAGAFFLARSIGFARCRTDREAAPGPESFDHLPAVRLCPTPPQRSGDEVAMRRVYLLVALGLAGCGMAVDTGGQPDPVQPDLDYPVGEFSLTERSGQPVTDKDLLGQVWVASFIFTRCLGPCPAVTSTVARLQAEFKDAPDVKFVTFTVDPKHDDLSTLREYANSRHADPKRWLFLTGDEVTIHKLMRERFKQPVERKNGSEIKPGDEFAHSPRLVLVDKKGIIRAMCDGLPNEHFSVERFENDIVQFQRRIRELRRE